MAIIRGQKATGAREVTWQALWHTGSADLERAGAGASRSLERPQESAQVDLAVRRGRKGVPKMRATCLALRSRASALLRAWPYLVTRHLLRDLQIYIYSTFSKAILIVKDFRAYLRVYLGL